MHICIYKKVHTTHIGDTSPEIHGDWKEENLFAFFLIGMSSETTIKN